MQVVKAIVILMGVLIFLGVGLLIYGFVTRIGNTAVEPQTVGLVPAEEPATIFSERVVDLLQGEVTQDSHTAENRVILRTRTPDGVERLRIISAVNGELVGTVTLKVDQP